MVYGLLVCAEIVHLNNLISPPPNHRHVLQYITLIDLLISQQLLHILLIVAPNALKDLRDALLQGSHDVRNLVLLLFKLLLLLLSLFELVLETQNLTFLGVLDLLRLLLVDLGDDVHAQISCLDPADLLLNLNNLSLQAVFLVAQLIDVVIQFSIGALI